MYVDAYWLELAPLDCIRFYNDYLNECESEDEWREAQRILASNDLFYLLTEVCGRVDMLHPWIYERCREVQKDPNGHLDLWAREHYKSTIITFGMVLLDIINNPNITIGIFSHTRDIAKAFLRQLMREMEDNKTLVDLFPEIFWEKPKNHSSKWSENDGLVVKRDENPKEATVEAWGLVDGMPTGRHFLLRVYDDVVTDKSVNTPEQIQKTTDKWALSDNLGASGGTFRVIGTRYHEFDTYHEMIKRDVVKLREHPCTFTGDEKFEYGVLKTEQELAQKRKSQGAYIFGAQMLLNPNADKTLGFKKEHLRYWEPTYEASRKLWRIMLVDPSSGKNKKDGMRKKRDYTALWCIGLGPDERWRVLDMTRDKIDLGGRYNAVETMHMDWKPDFVFYEETGFEADQDYFKIKAKETLYEMDMIPIRWSVSKDDRILALQPEFEQGNIILPRKLVKLDYEKKACNLPQNFVDEEYNPYPVLAHDDMLDSLANINHPEVKKRKKIPKKATREDMLRKARRAQRKARPVV